MTISLSVFRRQRLRGELCSITWSDVTLGEAPAIEVAAAGTKNKRRARIEVPRWLGQLLEQHRARRARELGGLPPATERVMRRCSYGWITARMKRDAVYAGIGRVDGGRCLTDAGRVVDLHSLRGTMATLAAEVGMPVKLLQEHMRHSDIRITMEVYTRVRAPAMRAAIEALPAPAQPVTVVREKAQ